MKKMFLFYLFINFGANFLFAQVTQINSNGSLTFTHPLSSNKAIFVSETDQHLWVTDGSLSGTLELSSTITFNESIGSLGFLDGQFIFAGSTATTGAEIYITDGTALGTILLKDIYPGTTGSDPDGGGAVLNGFLYFTAITAAEGRELWRTNGTTAGTTLVKDLVPGTNGSNLKGSYNISSTGTYLLLLANTPSSGIEPWVSDGSSAGTVVLKDIYPGINSSDITSFFPFNGIVLFEADNGINGKELWKTDGTTTGTVMVKDINPGAASSTSLFGTGTFFPFNGNVFFNADDGTNGEELWITDGTTANTNLVKDITAGSDGSFNLIFGAVIAGPKIYFPSTDLNTFSNMQIWESDGTNLGTSLFKNFDGTDLPILYPAYNLNATSLSQVLFQGNKFFFNASTALSGNELWISDGTVGNTNLVKDINAGTADGIDQSSLSYFHTSAYLFFNATNGINGKELWKSDGTLAGTTMVADIVTGAGNSDPDLVFFLVNGKVLFNANNGDDPLLFDLYAVDGSFLPLPVKLSGFYVTARDNNALIYWETLQELNSKNFTVQRSFDGSRFENIAVVPALGNSNTRHRYVYEDAGIVNSGMPLVYYRLLLTDNDGHTNYSHIINLKLKLNQWQVQMGANPVINELKFIISGYPFSGQISITDATGKTIYNQQYQNLIGETSIPASRFTKGVYILTFSSSSGRKTIRFIK